MPGFLVHVGATVLCSHGGQAQPTVPNPRVTVSGQPRKVALIRLTSGPSAGPDAALLAVILIPAAPSARNTWSAVAGSGRCGSGVMSGVGAGVAGGEALGGVPPHAAATARVTTMVATSRAVPRRAAIRIGARMLAPAAPVSDGTEVPGRAASAGIQVAKDRGKGLDRFDIDGVHDELDVGDPLAGVRT